MTPTTPNRHPFEDTFQCREALKWKDTLGDPLSIIQTGDPAAFQRKNSKITQDDGNLPKKNSKKSKSKKKSTRKKRKKQQVGIIMSKAELVAKGFYFQETITGIEVYRFQNKAVCPLYCSRCGKRFRSRSEIEQHINTHTGAKPFKCTVCSRGFANRANHRTHKCTTTTCRLI